MGCVAPCDVLPHGIVLRRDGRFSRVAARLIRIMAAFSSLTDRLSNAFKHLRSKGKLSEADIDGTIREIRRALLDADVALDVVRSFTSKS